MARLTTISANVNAFLDMIAMSEGTSTIAGSDDGYNVLVGGTLFVGYVDHPHRAVSLRPGLVSTAAGRYQLLSRYYDVYKRRLDLPDFSPESQDQIAIQQLKECGALPLIEEGQLRAAVVRASRIWASLPGNDYGQHQTKMSALEDAYQDYGGTLA